MSKIKTFITFFKEFVEENPVFILLIIDVIYLVINIFIGHHRHS